MQEGFQMLISMNMITSNFKNQKGRGAFSVKVPSLFERPSMTQRALYLFFVYMGRPRTQLIWGGDGDVSC